METLSTTTNTEVNKAITKPFEIIQLTVGATTYYLSTGGTVTWNAQSWTQSGAKLEDLRTLAGGAKEGAFSLQNIDNSASALVLANDFADAAVTIYQLYGDGPYAAGDEVELFSGVCTGETEIGNDRVVIKISTEGRMREMAPRVRYDQFTDWIPPAGTVISWQGEHYQLEPRGG